MNLDILEWDAPEYLHEEKSSDWYWSLGIIAASVAFLCILFNNLLFAVFIILAAFAAGMHAARPPRLIDVRVAPRGILSHNVLYTFDSLESFWIEERENDPRLLIKSKKLLMPLIVVPISPHVDLDEIRDYLLTFLPEVEHHESLGHRLLEYFGF